MNTVSDIHVIYPKPPKKTIKLKTYKLNMPSLKTTQCNLLHIEVPSKQKKATDPSEGLRCDKVDEGIAHIGTILRIHWQVEKVIAAFESRVVNLLQEASLRVPVWNVAEHHRRLWPNLLTWNLQRASFI